MDFKNRLKEKLVGGRITAGAWLQMGSPMAAEIMGRAGFDWLLIDMEHGPGDIPNLIAQLQAMAAGGSVPVVRAPWNDAVIIKRILDAGAMGVMIPAVSSKEEAEAAVRACKYPPKGIRGIATGTRAAGYGQFKKPYFAAANQEIMVVVQIETRQSLDNLEEIITVNGLDAIFIGPMDLATSMGHLANPAHPEVQEAIREVEKVALAVGLPLGTVASGWTEAQKLYARGYQLVTLMSEGICIANTAAALVNQFLGYEADLTDKE